MARKPKAAAAPAAAAPTLSPAAPHWQVARLAEPGQVFEDTDSRGVRTVVTADSRGIVVPRSTSENALVDRLPVASPELLASEPTADPAPIPDASPTEPTEPTDDAGADAEQED